MVLREVMEEAIAELTAKEEVKFVMEEAISELTIKDEETAKAAQHRLDRGVWTSVRFGDMRCALAMQEGSDIVVEGPRCSLRSRKVYSDLSVDYLKMFLLYVPATVVALGLFFFLDDLTGFEITYLLEGPCPNYGIENLSFFRTILSVSSGGVTNMVKCSM
ncbi:hypothetical protein JCGZ_08869 [Jatropha curcas]|uniref:Uncharacterized protein n=1 Tax=Jatropha curcas TaxID=180498 RepID=A0A067KK70_JATCU|nr:hypothetical protein JCGZ_08869 [Jatropha curcas]